MPQVAARIYLADAFRRSLGAGGLVQPAAGDVIEPYAYSDGGADPSFLYLQCGLLRVS